MGREVRRVPADWQHPRDAHGNYIPLYEYFPYEASEIQEGITNGDLTDEPPVYGMPVMPDWPDALRTHYQMYEDTTEGTPISPVMDSPEALAQWLVDNQASAFADQEASYEAWLKVCQGAWAPSAMWQPGQALISGVAYHAQRQHP